MELVLDALAMAVARRKPGGGLLHHSDRSCQYTSLEFGHTLKEAGILPSIGIEGWGVWATRMITRWRNRSCRP